MARIRLTPRFLIFGALAFVFVASCSDDDAEPTTVPSTVPTTTSTTTTTTTTTIPLIANGAPIAFEGDNNAIVEALQFLINCNEYAQLTVDGVFGPASRAAVETVQINLGREVTGAPDDETFAMLSRACSDDRRVTIDEGDGGAQIVVGNVANGDPDLYFIRVGEGQRLTVVLANEAPGAVINVRTADGGTAGRGGSTVWAADIDAEDDLVVEISGLDAITYTATFAMFTLEFSDAVEAAGEGAVAIATLESSVTGTCLDTDGEGSYVAKTVLGDLAVTTGRVGRFALDRGGVGAAVEFLFRDGTPGYYGFSTDLDAEVGERVVGTGIVFLQGVENADIPVGVAFNFDRPVIPCDGSQGTSIVLAANGLGVAEFGADPDDAIVVVQSALVGASPAIDSEWVEIENLSNEFGICREGTTEVRSVQIDNLTLFFTNGGTSFAGEGTRHFAGYTAAEGIYPLKTGQGVGPGDTLGQILVAHVDSGAAAGLTGGVDAFISSPPGSDRWLRATAAEAESDADVAAIVTSVSGGRFCDESP